MLSEQELRKRIMWASFEAGSQKVYARAIGISPVVLSTFMSGARKPSKGLLDALGYEKVTRTGYKRKQQHGG